MSTYLLLYNNVYDGDDSGWNWSYDDSIQFVRSKKSKNKNALISFSFSRITRFKLIVTKLLLLLRFSLFNKTAESILQHSKHSSICTYIYYNDDDFIFLKKNLFSNHLCREHRNQPNILSSRINYNLPIRNCIN